jgi:hypothetical protein
MDPRATLLAFLESAYQAGAATAGWPMEALRSRWHPDRLAAPRQTTELRCSGWARLAASSRRYLARGGSSTLGDVELSAGSVDDLLTLSLQNAALAGPGWPPWAEPNSLAMQKVVGSSPIIRFEKSPVSGLFVSSEPVAYGRTAPASFASILRSGRRATTTRSSCGCCTRRRSLLGIMHAYVGGDSVFGIRRSYAPSVVGLSSLANRSR